MWEDREANFERISNLLASAEIPAQSLVVLPEMFATGFSMNVGKVAEAAPSQAEAFLQGLAKQYDGLFIGGVVREAEGGDEGGRKGCNQSVAVDPTGQCLARYQKIRTFRNASTNEFAFYQRGTEVVTFDWGGFKICPLICYDLRFPELFRRGAAQGAQLFVVIASWPVARVDHWLTLLRARAIENQAYVVGVNRCGEDPNWDYPGASVVIDPHGKVLVNAREGEAVVSAEVSIEVVDEWRETFPALVDLEVE
ncbi:MAG: carbon-nitrogen family hydrolase [Verrucomicrobiales bacterium]|nr:carbon-nitrogen family hydrolase [Verrucomicrobiales bacterium]